MRRIREIGTAGENGESGDIGSVVWLPQAGGPAVVAVRADGVFDVTARFPTVSALCEEADPAAALRATRGERIGDFETILANTPPDRRDATKPHLLAPVALDEALIERARQAAGYKGYVTNIDPAVMDGHAVVAAYHDLWKVEQSFRMSKADLQARPIFHRQRDAIEAAADTLLSESADYKLLRRIPGIGPINALTILAEAGDLRRFSHHRQFLKFCGLDLATQQSGTFRGQTKLSKYGNARLRRTLWLAGQVAIRQRENGFRDKFERYIARDRHDADLRRKALTAITAKMARVVHAVIKTGADYRPFVEGPVPGGRTPLSRAVRA